MTYTANKKAYSLLESLTYWMAEISYCREKDPDDIGFLDKADKQFIFCLVSLTGRASHFGRKTQRLRLVKIGENTKSTALERYSRIKEFWRAKKMTLFEEKVERIPRKQAAVRRA